MEGNVNENAAPKWTLERIMRESANWCRRSDCWSLTLGLDRSHCVSISGRCPTRGRIIRILSITAYQVIVASLPVLLRILRRLYKAYHGDLRVLSSIASMILAKALRFLF